MIKQIILLLTAMIFLTSCGTSKSEADIDHISSSLIPEELSQTANPDSLEDIKEVLSEQYQKVEDKEIADLNLDLNDDLLQTYIKDRVYTSAVSTLDSNEYSIDNVGTVYYSKEYIEQLSYNSTENIYFGFTASELNNEFQDKKYVFTLGDDGQTIVQEAELYDDKTLETVLKNVAIGSGVILICVTVSAVTVTAAPAVSMIFAVGATTGTSMAMSGAIVGGISAGIAKGYQTGNFTDALQAAAVGASEGFKWGAISGALSGGASETWGLHKATANGLKMNEVALIQRDSKYPLDVISQFKSMDEYNIYKNAGLKTQMVNGKLALVQDIDWNQKVVRPDGTEVTNKWLVENGYAPVDPDGVTYELHHVNQDADGTLAILSENQHRGKEAYKILHRKGKKGVHNPESGLSDTEWNKIREAFWKDYLKQCMAV